jgi:hypothetical protein
MKQKIIIPCFSVDTIQECMSELSQPISNREEYLRNCIVSRLDMINELYLDEFNTEMSDIESKLLDSNLSVGALSVLLKRLCRLSNTISMSALKLIDVI